VASFLRYGMLKILLIASGTKMHGWVQEASQVYSAHLKEFCQFSLIEFPLEKRIKSHNIEQYKEKEATKITQCLPKNSYNIALDSQGIKLSSIKLAEKLAHIELNASQICFIIGGPDGLSARILKNAHEIWSLSDLTFSHPLVRVVILEAIYRGLAINNNHPYHR